jgi:hypothetical protein
MVAEDLNPAFSNSLPNVHQYPKALLAAAFKLCKVSYCLQVSNFIPSLKARMRMGLGVRITPHRNIIPKVDAQL